MATVSNSRALRVIPLLIGVCLVSFPAQAQYGGGTGELNDPYLIYTREQMNEIGLHEDDWEKHFKLMADIDLSSFSYNRALISPGTHGEYGFQGTPFTGTFDGNGHTISHLTIKGVDYLGLFGQLESEAKIEQLGVVDVNISGSGIFVGGLVGRNERGYVTRCSSTGTVSGGRSVGGLVGSNQGTITNCYVIGIISCNIGGGGLVGGNRTGAITNCYSAGSVTGNDYVGGLVGSNLGTVTNCYSTGTVRSTGENDGGLVGYGYTHGKVLYSVWDMETSGLSGSAGGVGLTTDQMMDPYMLALNGFGNDPNWILDIGRDYPRLFWEGPPGQAIPEPLIDWLDGTGTPKDPFQIENADQLLLLHKSSLLWDKHFVLNADIDLDPNLPGRSVFGQAVIPIFEGSFVGNGHVILNLQIEGRDTLGFFGKLSKGSVVRALGLENVSVHSTVFLVSNAGGLVGYNSGGYVLNCYSRGAVSGDDCVGGLVGENEGFVTECYSTAVVSGDWSAGGLVGRGNPVRVTYCFWDTQISGQDRSGGGTGLTTIEMQMAVTFLEAGWDLVGETENGTEDIWWILEGQGYPRLRELPESFRLGPLPALSPEPQDGASEVTQPLALHWAPADPTLQHDIYFGEDKKAVANATTESPGIYRGRQPAEITIYEPDYLESGKTYYWRIDEYNTDAVICKGHVWSLTTADFLVVDDFESYNDLDPYDPASNRIFETWIDGYDDPTNGSLVEDDFWMHWWPRRVHSGNQSMPFSYDNSVGYSEATANVDNLESDRDWTIEGVGVLSLWFHGRVSNAPEPMYVALANANSPTAVVYHNNTNAAQVETWTEWRIALQAFGDQGVDLTDINTISIGFGDKNNPQAGGSGVMYFDDIRLYRPVEPEPEP